MPEPTDPWSTEPTERIDLPYDAISSAEPPRRSSDSRLHKGALAAGIASLALVAAGVTGVALAGGGNGDGAEPAAVAATGGSTESAPPTDGQRPLRGPRGMGGLMGLAGAVHGEVVVPDGSGGWTTVVFQRGEATDVGSDTITVKSDDGHSESYDVPSGAVVGALREGLGSIKTGDQVLVMADKSGSGTPTARTVLDLDSVGRGIGGMMRGPFGGHGPWDDDNDGGDNGTGTDGSQGTGFGI